MDTPEEQIETLARNIERRELLARRRAWLLSLVPLIFAGLLLAYTVWQVAGAKLELAQTEAQLSTTSSQLDTVESNLTSLQSQLPTAQAALTQAGEELAQSQVALTTARQDLDRSQAALATAQADLKEAQVFIQNACPINVDALKDYLSHETPQAWLLRYLLDHQAGANVPWNPAGFSLEEGFDSPNFALFALQELDFLSREFGAGTRLWNVLPPTDQLADGDIVYYDSGYTMFYFNLPIDYYGSETRACVIGMTPLGIQSRMMNFAESPNFLKAPFNP